MPLREFIDRRVSYIGLVRTLLFVLLLLILGALAIAAFAPPLIAVGEVGGVALLALVGVMLQILGAIVDAAFFAGRVRCPCCHGKLWFCLSKGFKRRHFRLPKEVMYCPLCGIDLSREIPSDRNAVAVC